MVLRGLENILYWWYEIWESKADNIVDRMKPDIAVDDEGFKKLELHSATITVTTFVVTSVLFPIMVNLVSSYLYDQTKKMHRNKEDVSAKVNIISTDENGNRKKTDDKNPIFKYCQKNCRRGKN